MAKPPDTSVEEHEGPTPNGGVRSVAYYRDERGESAPKDRAVAVEVIEFDAAGQEIRRTYASLTG